MASEFVEVITVEQPYRCPRHEPVKALLDERDIRFPRLGGKHSLGRGPACAPGSPVTATRPSGPRACPRRQAKGKPRMEA
jgi:hypothetical protein